KKPSKSKEKIEDDGQLIVDNSSQRQISDNLMAQSRNSPLQYTSSHQRNLAQYLQDQQQQQASSSRGPAAAFLDADQVYIASLDGTASLPPFTQPMRIMATDASGEGIL